MALTWARLSLLLAFLCIAGCRTFHPYPDTVRHAPVPHTAEAAWVTNPGLSRELDILRESGLYSIATPDQATLEITLHELESRFGCANGASYTVLMTLGLLPHNFVDEYLFSFDVTNQRTGAVENIQVPIRARRRIWLLSLAQPESAADKWLARSLASTLGSRLNDREDR